MHAHTILHKPGGTESSLNLIKPAMYMVQDLLWDAGIGMIMGSWRSWGRGEPHYAAQAGLKLTATLPPQPLKC